MPVTLADLRSLQDDIFPYYNGGREITRNSREETPTFTWVFDCFLPQSHQLPFENNHIGSKLDSAKMQV